MFADYFWQCYRRFLIEVLLAICLLAGSVFLGAGAYAAGHSGATVEPPSGDALPKGYTRSLADWFPKSIADLVAQGFYQPAFEKLSEIARNGPTKKARANAKARLSLFYFHGLERPVEAPAGLALLKQAIDDGEGHLAWDVLGHVWAEGWMGTVDYVMAGFAWQAAGRGKSGREEAMEKHRFLHDRLELIVQDRRQPFFQLEQLLKAGRQSDMMTRLDEVLQHSPNQPYRRESLSNPAVRDAVAAYWLWSRLDEIWPPTILQYLVPRYQDKDIATAMRLYSLAILRASYDAGRCREAGALEIFGANLPDGAWNVAMMAGTVDARQLLKPSLEWAIARDDKGDHAYNTSWICRYASTVATRGSRAYWTALAPLAENIQRDKAFWPKIRQDVISAMQVPLQ